MRVTYYWHTLRYLKPVQFWYRPWFKLYKPRPDLYPALEIREAGIGKWLGCFRAASMLEDGTLNFLNENHSLETKTDWNNPSRSALWTYNAHYFDDLNAAGARTRNSQHEALVRRWLEENPPGTGPGWQPYPISLRAVNWIKWDLSNNGLDVNATQSLAAQVRYLSKRLEYHLQANHLWANAKALVFAGSYFEGDEAEGWLRKGLSLVAEQLGEQVLADGGHYERSPMYHAIVLEDLLDLIQLASLYSKLFSHEQTRHWEQISSRMLSWLNAISHPDGDIAFFNDAAIGIAPAPDALMTYAKSQGVFADFNEGAGVRLLASSGYVVARSNSAAYLVADVAEIGPDYQPGHAHADTLSFEFSLFSQRLIVNSGIDRYGDDAERLRQRSTSAHNTIEINNKSSSEVWSGFRVARRARPFDYQQKEVDGGVAFSCSHDGYQRLNEPVIHNRQWQLKDSELSISDELKGNFQVAISRYHLHPDVEVLEFESGSCLLRYAGREVALRVEGGDLSIAASTYHPEFGRSLASKCITIELTSSVCSCTFSW